MKPTDFQLIGDWPDCDYSVVGIVLQDEQKRIACQLRDDFDHVDGGGLWTIFGGHHEPPETLLDCAARELEEELGVRGQPTDFEPLARFVPKKGIQAYHYYFRYLPPVKPADFRLTEGAGFGFLHKRQIETLPFMPSAVILLDHFKASHEIAQ